MKRKVILASMALLAATMSTNAQTMNVKYQGEVQAGYSIGIGTLPADRFNLHMINSARFNPYFSLGVGTGLDYYLASNFEYNKPELVLPIFLNTKGYLPVSATGTDLFLSLDLGYSIGITEGVTGMSGLMLTPAIGASFKISDRNAITLSLGYNHQAWSESGLSVNFDAIQFKAGLKF